MRIISLNAHCLSPIFNKAIWNGEAGERCAHRIGTQLLEDGHDYDVIGLSEVWDEDAKDSLLSMLQTKYPYWVYKIADGSFDEDSGLMLFSRYPLVKLDGLTYTDKPGPGYLWDRIVTNAADNAAAFLRFKKCAGMDCMAFKGALAVTVQMPDVPHRYNIVVTHTQADDEPVIRQAQMDQIRTLVLKSFGWSSLKATGAEDTFVMGDLNIQGNICDPSEEWKKIFRTQGQFFTKPLYDSWWWTTSPKDCGATFTTSQSRYDYMIHNKYGWPHSDPEEEIACVQHLTRPFFHSDHRAVFADVNHVAPRCNPRVAKVIKAKPNDPAQTKPLDTAVSGNLAYRGSMQWFRINAPGTHTLRLPQVLFGPYGFGIEMYAKEDLTNPISANPGEITEGSYQPLDQNPVPVTNIKFHVAEPPIYIRVYHHDRQANGPYVFYVHKANCLTPEDACLLGPNESLQSPGLTQATAYNGGPVYFKGYIDHAVSYKEQALDFILENGTNKDMRLELLDDAENVIDAAPPVGGSNATKLTVTRKDAGPYPFYLRVHRQTGDQLDLKAGFETNLRYFVGAAIPNAGEILMYIGDETGSDWSGSDEGSARYSADGQLYMPINYGGGDSDDYYWFDRFFRQYSQSYNQYNGLPVVGYVDSMTAQLCEFDPDANQCDFKTLADVAKGDKPLVNTWTHFKLGDGDYDLYYSVTRNGLYR